MPARFGQAIRAGVVVTVALALLSVPAPALAAEGDLLVSTDGVTYSADNTLPVFPDSWRFVPGDSESQSVWVRNAADTAGTLRIDLIDPRSDDMVFASHLAIAATPEGEPLTPVGFDVGVANGACTVLGIAQTVAPYESVRIDIAAAVSTALTGQEGVRAKTSFALRATLVDAAAGLSARTGAACTALPTAAPTAAPAPPGALPHTGGTVPWTLAVLGGAALGSGLLAFVLGRRRRNDEADRRVG